MTMQDEMAKAAVAEVNEASAAVEAVTDLLGGPIPVNRTAVNDPELNAKLAEINQELAKEPGIITKLPLGDLSRWKDLDSASQAYEIKDRGVIVRTWNAAVYVPGAKLAPDINNGFRIVAG